jgi:dephospho-CoA kinase
VIEKVGLTGFNASGKGEAAKILQKYGYSYFSLSDVVRDEAVSRGLDTSRDNLIMTGNSMRREHGAGVLAETIYSRLDDYSVIDSIRNPEEVHVLRNEGNFILLGIQADARKRFERMKQRGRSGDALNFEEFVLQEHREMDGSPSSQQLARCLEMADVHICNNGTLKDLEQGIAKACGITGKGI